MPAQRHVHLHVHDMVPCIALCMCPAGLRLGLPVAPAAPLRRDAPPPRQLFVGQGDADALDAVKSGSAPNTPATAAAPVAAAAPTTVARDQGSGKGMMRAAAPAAGSPTTSASTPGQQQGSYLVPLLSIGVCAACIAVQPSQQMLLYIRASCHSLLSMLAGPPAWDGPWGHCLHVLPADKQQLFKKAVEQLVQAATHNSNAGPDAMREAAQEAKLQLQKQQRYGQHLLPVSDSPLEQQAEKQISMMDNEAFDIMVNDVSCVALSIKKVCRLHCMHMPLCCNYHSLEALDSAIHQQIPCSLLVQSDMQLLCVTSTADDGNFWHTCLCCGCCPRR